MDKISPIKAYAAMEKGGPLQPFEYTPDPLEDTEIEIDVESCGLCHSDLSMLDNEWEMTRYPFVPGHEVIGRVAKFGTAVKSLKVGQRVGLGWYCRSCMTCEYCLSGNHHLCPYREETIVGRHGGFANKVRAHEGWVIPVPEDIDPIKAGPLFCGGITVFHPIIQLGIKPTDHIGVIGIGGLGHIALKFLHAWGCEVTAFSSNPDKTAAAKDMGASHVVNSRDPEALQSVANSLDMILSTVAVNLDWNVYISALKPQGKLHFVGIVPSPLNISLDLLIDRQKSLTASSLGSPATVLKMLNFAQRHHIEPIVEIFPFSRVNQAMDRLRQGQPRYRAVLASSAHSIFYSHEVQ